VRRLGGAAPSKARRFVSEYLDLQAKETVMGKGRLEAFSDGVIAIIITIMVLELKVPHGAQLADLGPLLPVFLSYVLSCFFLQH
jgi:uncharacterized membrane protein